MLRIGLTGGVGCGKSTVASLFAGKGVPVFDADQIARELVEPGQVAFAAIVAEFGGDILEHGRINRARLRDRVFAHPLERQMLEAIIHPLVYQALADRAVCLDGPYCIFAIPLLVETGRLDFVDRILVVDCHPDQQYERVRQRDSLDEATVGRIIQVQAKRGERLAVANDVIENTGLIEQLRVQVDKLHEAYLTLVPRISLRSIDAAID